MSVRLKTQVHAHIADFHCGFGGMDQLFAILRLRISRVNEGLMSDGDWTALAFNIFDQRPGWEISACSDIMRLGKKAFRSISFPPSNNSLIESD